VNEFSLALQAYLVAESSEGGVTDSPIVVGTAMVLEHEGYIDDSPAAGLEHSPDFEEGSAGVPDMFESLAAEDEIIGRAFDGRITDVPKDSGSPTIVAIQRIKKVGGEERIVVAGLLLIPTDPNVKHSPLSGGVKLLGALGKLDTLDLSDEAHRP
jgi:hypothetical protein